MEMCLKLSLPAYGIRTLIFYLLKTKKRVAG
jgi:hypothetical protein